MRNKLPQQWIGKENIVPSLLKIRRRSKFFNPAKHNPSHRDKAKIQKIIHDNQKRDKFGRIGPLEGED